MAELLFIIWRLKDSPCQSMPKLVQAIAILFSSLLITQPLLADQVLLQYQLDFGGSSNSDTSSTGEFNLQFQTQNQQDFLGYQTHASSDIYMGSHAAALNPTSRQINIPISQLLQAQDDYAVYGNDEAVERTFRVLVATVVTAAVVGVVVVGYVIHETTD